MLALISKAQFDRHWSSAEVGARLGMDRYDSTSKQLRPLEDGGALFLVTVRGPDERLWLVAILEAPAFDGKRWSADPSVVPVADITHLRGELRFTTGKGVSPKARALGMSLQTPRQLTTEDTALLRQAVAGLRKKGAAKKHGTAGRAKKKVAGRAGKKMTAGRAGRKEKAAEREASRAADVPGPGPSPRPLPAEADALLEQVVANPDDLDVRRVYADLLMEHGDPQGEHIQLSCALEQMAVDDPRRAQTREAVESQWHRHGLRWSRALRQVGPFNRSGAGTSPISSARGFPETLGGGAAEIVPHLEQAVGVAPIRALDLGVDTAGLKALAATPALAQIRALALRCDHETSTRPVIKLLASPHLRRLERFELHGGLCAELAAALARCEALAGCRELTLVNTVGDEIGPDGAAIEPEGLGPDGLGLLCQSAGLSRLERLTLHRARLGPDGIAALDALKGLRRLSITWDRLGVRGAQALAATAGLATLDELVLERCELGPKGLTALVAAPSFAGLRRLDLQGPGNGLGRGLEALLRTLELPRLEALGLGQGMIRETGARLLATTDKLKQLVELDVSGCSLKEAGIEALAAARFPRLRTLKLISNSIDAGGMEALARGPLLAPVRDLDLAGNKFQNAGGKALAACPHLATVESLRLHYNWMGVGGLKAILAATPALVQLDCGENNYSNAPGQVVASGTLTRLRRLHAWEQNGPTVTQLARSAAGCRLEQLALDGSCTITDEGAEALARLPNLGSLHLSFPHISREGMAALRGRFGPFLSVWPDVERWNTLPGPP